MIPDDAYGYRFSRFMTFERGNIGYLIAFILVGAILGSAVGELAAKLIPALSILRENLTSPIGFNLEIISFSLRLNSWAWLE